FLFDGVPPLNKTEITAIKDSISIINVTTKQILASSNHRNEFNLHQPYKERDCASCHNRNDMEKIKLPTPDLCNQCHTDFRKTFKTLHGPLDAGDCFQCHTPHQSKLKNLLVESGEKLCFICHDAQSVSKNIVHKDIKNVNCIECHNPHGGNGIMVLRSESCYKCHDNYKEEYKFLHGPVDSGDCFECHKAHKTNATNLLLKTNETLCLSCHDAMDILTTEYHENTKENKCIECHDPHGGKSNKFFLIDNR
ncbi:cytochrome c3 family protein, partial [Lutibacter sp.]